MTWYIAMTDAKDVFPVFVNESTNIIEIPRQSINSTFTFDNDTWIITEKYPHIENELVEWKTRPFAQLITFQKMWCLPDVDRQIQQRGKYLGKTLIIDEKEYTLSKLKCNEYHSAVFYCFVDGKTLEIMFRDDYMFLGNDETGEWMKKDIVWKE